MTRHQTVLTVIGSVALVVFALALDLSASLLLLMGIGALWPNLQGPLTWVAALFILGYPLPVLFWMLEPVRRVWGLAPSTEYKKGNT